MLNAVWVFSVALCIAGERARGTLNNGAWILSFDYFSIKSHKYSKISLPLKEGLWSKKSQEHWKIWDTEKKFKSTWAEKLFIWSVPIAESTFTLQKCGMQGTVYREKKPKAFTFSEFIARVFSPNFSFSVLLVLSSSCFPFILFFTSLPYIYLGF